MAERVSQVSSDLQQLGRRTGMTVIALSQLSRAEIVREKPYTLVPGYAKRHLQGQRRFAGG